MKLYLAGAMRGFPRFNFPKFIEVANKLREAGHEIANPAEHDLESTPQIVYEPGYEPGDPSQTRLFDSRAAFSWDFKQIIDAHGIALMEGWENSTGAKVERLVAEMTGKIILLVKELRNSQYRDRYVVDLGPDPVQVRMKAVLCE